MLRPGRCSPVVAAVAVYSALVVIAARLKRCDDTGRVSRAGYFYRKAERTDILAALRLRCARAVACALAAVPRPGRLECRDRRAILAALASFWPVREPNRNTANHMVCALAHAILRDSHTTSAQLCFEFYIPPVIFGRFRPLSRAPLRPRIPFSVGRLNAKQRFHLFIRRVHLTHSHDKSI